MSEELKPCPFCGKQPIIREDWYDFPILYRYECPNCGKASSYESTVKQAKEKWNERIVADD